MNKEDLISFENKIADKFLNGELPYLIHFSGGNEDMLLKIFSHIKEGDYVFSTHRNHYHYLLKGGSQDRLENLISSGRSMFVFDRRLNFYSSSIVCATPSIAAGVALALKKKGSPNRVWCFIGDGAEDEGHFYEAVRYVDGWELPCTFIIEDNNRSVNASKKERWNNVKGYSWPQCVMRYEYIPTYPHGGIDTKEWIRFKKEAIIERPQRFALNKYYLSRDNEIDNEVSYMEAVKLSMNKLAKQGFIFIGYNVGYGSAYGTLNGFPCYKIETPLAENLMTGIAIGMSLEDFKVVLFFERHDFIYNALDALVNQVDKIFRLSQGEFSIPIIIKAVSGSIRPFYAGATHTSNLSELFNRMFSFPVYTPVTSSEVIDAYNIASELKGPVMVCEDKELYI